MLGVKAVDRIDLATTPEHANRIALANIVLANREVIFGRVVRKLPLFQDRDQIIHLPKLVSDFSGHCRSHPQRLMDANEIVVERVERDCCSVVFNLLAECVGQPSKAAHVHPHREIAALNV